MPHTLAASVMPLSSQSLYTLRVHCEMAKFQACVCIMPRHFIGVIGG